MLDLLPSILAELRAARSLANEVRGIIGAFERVLVFTYRGKRLMRATIGNTNVAALKAKLAAYDAATKGEV